MNPIRVHALKLRLSGQSYNEITEELGVPKSTLSNWFSRTVLSSAAQARLKARVRQGTVNAFVRRNKLQTHEARKRALLIRSCASELIPALTDRDLQIMGAVLYWAEGYKRPRIRDGKERTAHTISFVNADEIMIRAFLRFLIRIIGIPVAKIRLNMRLYKHINAKVAMEYWASVTGLPQENFRSVTYLVSIASKRRRPQARLPYGTLQIEVCDTAKFHHLMGLIEGVKKQF